ncbi:MAG: hypothetical protein J3Q66DRAFT_356475 [Benniella sp.]|nr:MAG: hypothetical protein J3Q66DRAFT_356475 [Benniella sp.]
MLGSAAHSLRPHVLLRSAVRNASLLSESACMSRRPSSAFLQSQRFASTASAANLRQEATGLSLLQSMNAPTATTMTTTASRSWIVTVAATTCVVGPLIASRSTAFMGYFATFTSARHVVHCAAATNRPGAYSIPELEDPLEREPIFKTKELIFGMLMGLCSGYLFNKPGKLMMLVVGFGFSGYIQVNWPLIERRFKETFGADGDGKITLNDAKYGFRWLMELLTF